MYDRFALLLPLLASACAGGGGTDPAICDSTSQALYGGAADSGRLQLDVAAGRAIVALEAPGGAMLCTGTFVSKGWVLTAGHCAIVKEFVVRLPSGERVEPLELFRHAELDALLARMPAVNCSCGECGRTIPASSEAPGVELVGTRVTLAGAGYTEDGRTGQLRFADEVVTDVRDTEIWVDGGGRSGACNGDSGGPMLAVGPEGARVLGILSRGSADCLGKDVYTRTDALHAWLEETTSSH